MLLSTLKLGLLVTFCYTFNFWPLGRAHADLPTIKADNGRYKDCDTSSSVIWDFFSELPVAQDKDINMYNCVILVVSSAVMNPDWSRARGPVT